MISLINNMQVNNKQMAFRASLYKSKQSTIQADNFEPAHQKSEKYIKAKAYLDVTKNKTPIKSLDFFDLEKLNGLQEGIKVFKNMSMKEIYFATYNLNNILISRGCRNRCAHCYIDALPPSKNSSEKIYTMAWEDLKSLTGGIKELNKRLGFNCIIDHGAKPEIYLFEDSDPINTKLSDKDGNTYNIKDAIKTTYEDLEIPVVFDTSGWFSNDKHAKKAADDLVKYLEKEPDAVSEVNISINPFHGLLKRSNELLKKGNLIGHLKLHDMYIDRMVETLETFAPLKDKVEFGVLFRFAKDLDKNEGYTKQDLNKLEAEILTKLAKKDKSLAEFAKHIFDKVDYIAINTGGRANQFFSNTNIKLKNQSESKLLLRYIENYGKTEYFKERSKSIDCDGTVIAGNENVNIKTGIKFNFKNKDKKTRDFIITMSDILPKEEINKKLKNHFAKS